MKKKDIYLKKLNIIKTKEVQLPASKSISNRALIIRELSGNDTVVSNLSTARDTQLMQALLTSDEDTLDAMDAGTTMRFLTAFHSVGKKEKALTGTPRMCKRPIGLLVDALRALGSSIEYSGEEGYPPLSIKGLKKQLTNKISIRGDVSSQYISALLMVGPVLPDGLELTLAGKVGSMPYIEMTLNIMKSFGASFRMENNVITVQSGGYKSLARFDVEPDWSAASYWYGFVALAEGQEGTVTLKGLGAQSLQGDSVIADLMSGLGVKTTFNNEGAMLEKIPAPEEFEYDFTHCPDLAQTVAVVCATKGIKCKMTGLESLKIKETDRVEALRTELGKMGAVFSESDGVWRIEQFCQPTNEAVVIDTYEDHRMAMAFAPLMMLQDMVINDPEVVRKSYPHFWEDVGGLE